jgi:hypothetical protein
MSGYDYDFGTLGGGAAELIAAAGNAQFSAKTLLIFLILFATHNFLYYCCSNLACPGYISIGNSQKWLNSNLICAKSSQSMKGVI